MAAKPETFDDPFQSPETMHYDLDGVTVQNDLYQDVTMCVTTKIDVGEVDMGLDVDQYYTVHDLTVFDTDGEIIRSRIE